MKWVLIVGGAIMSLIVIVTVVGMLLPRDHVVTLAARIAAAPDRVWDAMIEQAQHTGVPVIVEVSEPPTHLLTRIAPSERAFGGTWEFRVSADGPDASRVIIIERGSVYNPVFRFVSKYVMGHTATIDAFLRTLGKKFGDEPTPTVAITYDAGA